MTRETKVGLLVGMGVILLIGIIISDHLSQVNEQSPAAESMTGFAERAQDSINPLVEPEPLTPPPAGPLSRREGSILQRVQPVPTPREMERPRWEQANQPAPVPAMAPELPRAYAVETPAAVPTGDASPMGRPLASMPQAPSSYNAEPVAQPQFVPPVTINEIPTLTLGGTPTTAGAERTRLASAEGAAQPFDAAAHLSTQHTDAALAEAARQAAAPPLPGAGATGTEFIHYVKEGETLYAIAEKFYGNGDYWKSIAQNNPGKVMANGQVRPNVRLVIPNRAGLAQLGPDFVPVGSDAPGRIQLAQGEPPSGPVATVKADRTINVEEGDTLTKLASEHLGTAGAWRKLLDANRDRLSRPEDLRVGMKLVLPAEATAATATTAGGSSAKPQAAAGPAKPQAAAPANEYVIEEGDTLYKIASKTLGNGNRWREVYDANKDRLKNPDAVAVGVKLRIPAR